jgi:hypothetical protein
MMNRMLVFVLAALLLVGCGQAVVGQPATTPTPPPVSTPTPPPTPIVPSPTAAVDVATQIQLAEQTWKKSQIASYRISVLEIHSIWSAQTTTITVTDGLVVDIRTMCVPAPVQGRTCTIQPVEANAYLVPALFAQARELVARQRPEFVRFRFDPSVGYPTLIGFDDPQILDEDYGLSIEEFAQLPGRPADQIGQDVRLNLGASAQVDGLRITLVDVVEDSRCPSNVACVWAGQVIAKLSVTGPNLAETTLQLKLQGHGLQREAPTRVGDRWQIQITSVLPYPTSPTSAPAESYIVNLRVSR